MPTTPAAPQTWTMLQAIQYRIFAEVLVNGASPFSTWNATDQAKYGDNPFGAVSTAIYIGVPKDWPAINYVSRMCHIIPATDENVAWRALGGKTWDQQFIYVRFLYSRKSDWYQTQQDLLAARDAMYVMMSAHAELPNAPTVAAAKMVPPHNIPAYHHDNAIGEDWDCWGFAYWTRQEWFAPGGISA
jgi:hypothetical protein